MCIRDSCGTASLDLSTNLVSGVINWYNDISLQNLVNTGNTFTTPVLNMTTDYYVQSVYDFNTSFGGALDNSIGSGGYFNGNQHLIFDITTECKIVSAIVYADNANTITFELRDNGGNVIDAAISAGLVQTAVDPQMCGIAGFGSCHIYLADGTHKIIDFHGRAPLATRSDMWEDLIRGECDDGFGFLLDGQVNELGYQCMTTPMTLKAFDDILNEFGTLSIADALKPAINYCEEGFIVRPQVHNFWTTPDVAGRIARVRGMTENHATAKIYTKADGSLYSIGDILKNPDMAETYRRIAKYGVDDFYNGKLAKEIADDMFVGVTANNIFDAFPDRDAAYGGSSYYPFFVNANLYPITGPAVSAVFSARF